MIEAAVANGWLDRQRTVLETLTSIRRAGADIVEVEGSHVIMVSQPEAVTGVISEALAAVGALAPAG